MEAATQTALSPELTAGERQEALAAHDQTDHDYLAAIAGLNEAQWTFHPAPDCWSIQGVAEHIVIVETLLQKWTQQCLAGDPDPQWTAKTGLFNDTTRSRVIDRANRVQAPEMVVPRHTWTIEETLRRFDEARAVSREMLERPVLALKAHVGTGGPGTYNCHGWLMWMSLHHQRHLLQIAEVKANPAFPH